MVFVEDAVGFVGEGIERDRRNAHAGGNLFHFQEAAGIPRIRPGQIFLEIAQA